MKTLNELKADNALNNFVTIVNLEHEDYAHYYINNEYVGYAEYFDTSNFNPFTILGFVEIIVNISVDEDYENYEEAEQELTDLFTSDTKIMEQLRIAGLKSYLNVDVN